MINNVRKAIGRELKDNYFNVAVKNCKNAAFQAKQPNLFAS